MCLMLHPTVKSPTCGKPLWLLILVTLLAIFPHIPTARAELPSPKSALTPAEAAQDARIAMRALRELHPALTKYQTVETSNAAFARFEQRANAARTPTELFLAATELAASIRCGHTWTNTSNQGGAIRSLLLGSPNKLPFLITVVESRFLVLASADPAVQKGDEIVSINGQRAAQIIASMLPYLRADGASDGKRIKQLSHDRYDRSMMDIVWPLLSPPIAGRYALEILRGDHVETNVSVTATTLADRARALKAQGIVEQANTPDEERAWTLAIDKNVATMRLPSFALWRTKFDYNAWLAQAFARLSQEGVTHLIIDIRANEGGDGAVNHALLSHLLKTPFTWPEYRPIVAYERVPYILVKYLDTWDYGFFDRTGQVEKVADKKFVFTPRANVDRTIKPVATPFNGKTYLLVGPENSSATFHLASLAKISGAATLVGETTGGNLRGLNATELTWVTLPNSGVAIDIPLIAQVSVSEQPDAPVEPTVVVQQSFAATKAGTDLVMTELLRSITRGTALTR